MSRPLLIFDMDGVLVDVTASYRATIQQTVAHFTGSQPTAELIQEYKERGGFNDDWVLSRQMIQDAGFSVEFNTVVDHFQSLFHGKCGTGLILKERWIAGTALLERLAETYTLAIFTGRLHWEADVSLNRFAPGLFEHIIGVDEVIHPKPSPEGIEKLRARIPHTGVHYIGDSVDDARAGRAAGVPFIGIAEPGSRLASLLSAEGAIEVISDINILELAMAAHA